MSDVKTVGHEVKHSSAAGLGTEDLKFVGQSSPRIDGKPKITGAAQFIDDIEFGNSLLYAEVVESPHAHALVKRIDTSAAEAVDGVVKVVTGASFPFKFGLYMRDRHIFAQDRVRFVGEQVAAVIARDAATAKRAAALVEVEYEVLAPVLDVDTALAEGGELLHPELGTYDHVPWFYPNAGTNIAHWRKVRKGDVDAAFAEADLVYEETYRVPRYAHCAIEVHGAIGLYDFSGRLTMWTASQSPATQRGLFAEALAPLGLSHKDVRVITPYVGGGFGGKAGVSMEIVAAALAMTVQGRPVKLLWSREQEFYNTYQRQGLKARVKVGVKRDGTIIALDHLLHWDAGAYVEYGANVVNASGLAATGPYRIPNVSIDAVCVYTNLPPGGPYRGFGYSEVLFGLESAFNEISKQLGIDPVDFRRKNHIRTGDILPYGAHMNPCGMEECIDKVAEAIEWGKKVESPDPNIAVGRGFALFWKGPAMPPNAASTAFLKFNEDGSINILCSAMEIGQGFLVAMAQIAAEVLTVPVEKIRVETPDTDRNPYEWQTVASHITWGTGNAVKKAAEDARDQIFDTVARARDLRRDSLYLEAESVRSTDDPSFAVPLRSFVINGLMVSDGTFRGGPVIGRGMFMPEFSSTKADPETSQGGKPTVHYTVGAAAIQLEIDRQTGKVRIPKVVLAVDAGKAINPQTVRDQITGGLVQGIATVLFEDMRFSAEGRLLNANFTDYKIPTAMDTPDEIIPIIVEVPQPDGPFGARGVGEHTMIPAAPIIANAVDDALGIRIKSMPITAQKIATELHGL